MSPLATLGRGYAVLTTLAGDPVFSTGSIAAGDPFVARLSDGRIRARAEGVEPATREEK